MDQKAMVIVDLDDVIETINARPMKYRWALIKKILDQVPISELTDQQRQQIKTYLQTELKKLE